MRDTLRVREGDRRKEKRLIEDEERKIGFSQQIKKRETWPLPCAEGRERKNAF